MFVCTNLVFCHSMASLRLFARDRISLFARNVVWACCRVERSKQRRLVAPTSTRKLCWYYWVYVGVGSSRRILTQSSGKPHLVLGNLGSFHVGRRGNWVNLTDPIRFGVRSQHNGSFTATLSLILLSILLCGLQSKLDLSERKRWSLRIPVPGILPPISSSLSLIHLLDSRWLWSLPGRSRASDWFDFIPLQCMQFHASKWQKFSENSLISPNYLVLYIYPWLHWTLNNSVLG